MKKQINIFLKGKKVILRPLEQSDAETLVVYANDSINRQFLTRNFPLNVDSERDWINKQYKNSKLSEDVVLGIVEIKTNKLVGTIGIHRIDWISRTAFTGTLIGAQEFREKGLGTDAKMILLDYCFNVLNLRKVCSAALAFNMRSINYSLKCGYRIEGRLKNQFYKNGKYCDEVFLAIFKKDFLKSWKEYSARK